jgi:hypothetical protein
MTRLIDITDMKTVIYIPICLSIYLSIYGSTVLLLDLDRFFSSLILYTVGRFPLTSDQPIVRPLPIHRTAQTQNKRTQYRHPCLK